MKRIYLLRHAQALSASGGRDIDRVLSSKGEDDARALGIRMLQKNYIPQSVFCSPAVRTRMTLAGAQESVAFKNSEYVQDIYDQGLEVYMQLIHRVTEDTNSVMIVGHNPSVHAAAANLALEDGSAFLGRIMNSYAPGTLSVFESAAEKWTMVGVHGNKLIDVLTPEDYNAG